MAIPAGPGPGSGLSPAAFDGVLQRIRDESPSAPPDENIILAGILWKFLREPGTYLLDGSILITTSVELSPEEEALLKELKQRKDLKI